MALALVKSRFIYVLQHDFKFIREIDHTSVIKSMIDYPNILKIVRFNKRRNVPVQIDKGECFGMKTEVDHVNGVNFTKTPGWSDNNHLTTKVYYEELLKRISFLHRAPEGPMQGTAKKDCETWGPLLYGARGDEATLAHLDGRSAWFDKGVERSDS
jgi:hypothetical protein